MIHSRGSLIITANLQSKSLALTYDDGPYPTDHALVSVLAKHNVKATFFLLGSNLKEYGSIAKELAEAGHIIGNHTYSHTNLKTLPKEAIKQEISSCAHLIHDTIGDHSNLFRPPYVMYNDLVNEVLFDLDMINVLWDAAGHDWRPGSTPDIIEANVVSELKGPGIILLHDTVAATAQATEQIILRYRDQGYEFFTIPELMCKE